MLYVVAKNKRILQRNSTSNERDYNCVMHKLVLYDSRVLKLLNIKNEKLEEVKEWTKV